MYTKAELISAIEELTEGKHTIQNCERLASVYTVLDHLYGAPSLSGASHDSKIETETIIGSYGNSQFLETVSGLPSEKVWPLIDELVEAINVLNPRLASSFLSKLHDL